MSNQPEPEAPERVWVATSSLLRGYGYTYLSGDDAGDLVQYVRADLAQRVTPPVAPPERWICRCGQLNTTPTCGKCRLRWPYQPVTPLAPTCALCGHARELLFTGYCKYDAECDGRTTMPRYCGCKCEFPPTTTAAAEDKGMNQAETFEWLRQRSNRLDEAEAELVKCQLERARLQVKPIVDHEKTGEEVGDLMNMRLDAAALAAECVYCGVKVAFPNKWLFSRPVCDKCVTERQAVAPAETQGELLPCPWCGAIPLLFDHSIVGVKDEWSVYCEGEMCAVAPSTTGEFKQHAVSQWNNQTIARRARAPVAPDDERVKEIRERRRDNFRELGNDEWRGQYSRDIEYLLSLLDGKVK